jgi:phage-related protein
MERSKPLKAVFYQSASGNMPVREWLRSLSKPERFHIGVDIWKIQSEWPIGLPHVRSLGDRLNEVRSNLPDGIARVIFIIDGGDVVLLHGFIKKTQKTPPEILALAKKRKRDYEQNKKD